MKNNYEKKSLQIISAILPIGLAGLMIMLAGCADEPVIEDAITPEQESVYRDIETLIPGSREIGEGDIEKAAELYMAGNELNRQLQLELEDIDDQTVIQEKIMAAEETLLAKAEEIGMPLDEYDQVMQVVQQDEQMLEEFLFLIGEEIPTIDPQDISDQDITNAADVYHKLNALQQKLHDELEGIEDQTVMQQLFMEAEQEMIQIVDDAGFGLEEYSLIMQAIQRDEDLREKFLQHLR